MLTVKNLRKVYKSGKAKNDVTALNGVSIDFPEKGFVFLLGKSGSGKSTLLNVIGGLDCFDSGEIIIKGKSSKDFSQSDFDSYRNTFIGFIFQEYNILENFTVAKNLALAIELQGKKAKKEEVNRLLEKVELKEYAKRKPNQLSGGQKQRVAIARALIKNPEIIMADEPTGALDSATGKMVFDTLKELSKTKLVIVVSHDRDFAELYGDRIIELKDGKIISDVTKKEMQSVESDTGVKLIDNSILYIQKGKTLNDEDVKTITDFLIKRTENDDTYISFNEESNKKFRESAKINENGNCEKFVDTTEEDIEKISYNPFSLKLIRSRLKFVDSLKMGTSSLKHKVGKLIITILLSLFAFTVFGVVDTLSCWDRARSVYKAMEMTGQTNVGFVKRERFLIDDEWNYNDTYVKKSDFEYLKEKFPDYNFNGVVGENSSIDVKFKSEEVELEYDYYNIYNNTSISGYISVTEQELDDMGFTLDGKLPENSNQICISKHIYDVLVDKTKDSKNPITNYSDLSIYIYDYNISDDDDDYITPIYILKESENLNDLEPYSDDENYLEVVGVVDDKTDLSKLKNLDVETSNNYALMYLYQNILEYGYSNIVYVCSEKYQEFYESGNGNSCCLFSDDEYYNHYMDRDDICVDGIDDYTVSEDDFSYLSEHLSITAEGKITGLGENEIIMPVRYYYWYDEEFYNSMIDEYANKIEDGYNVALKEFYYGDAICNMKIVGISNDGNYYMNASNYNKNYKELFEGYNYVLTTLKGQRSSDRELIEYLETYDSNNVKYVVENTTTTTLDLLEEFIMFTAKFFLYIGIVFAVFASFLLMNFISTSISYKKREIGVLRALGARGNDIFGIFFNESTVIALINFVLSGIATIVACYFLNVNLLSSLDIEIVLFFPGLRQVLLLLLISWGSALISSFIPTMKISRKKPIDAINNR